MWLVLKKTLTKQQLTRWRGPGEGEGAGDKARCLR